MSKSEILTPETIRKSIKDCSKISLEIISQLQNLEEQIRNHNGKILAAKTSGTTVTALGTGLAVTGLIMAPFTLGTSLILSSVGAVTSVSGAGANLITDLVDRSKRNKFINNIHTLSTDQQDSKADLLIQLELLTAVLEPLMDKGLTETQALFAAMKGDRCTKDSELEVTDSKNGDEDFEWVQAPNGKWKPVRKFCFKAGLNSLKLVKNSRTLTTLAGSGASAGGAVFNVGTRTATAATASGGGILARVGHFLGSAAFKGTMAAVGVVFTTIDIALLVKEWKTKNPTSETIEIVIAELKVELEEYEKLLKKLEIAEETKIFLGWMVEDQIPIVGTSPFAVEGLKAVCEGHFNRVRGFYGDLTQLTPFSKTQDCIISETLSDDHELRLVDDDHKPTATPASSDQILSTLNILYSQKLIEGPCISLEKLNKIVVQVCEKSKKNQTSPSEPISDLYKDLLSKLITQDDSVRIPVFSTDVLKVNQEIIDRFLEQSESQKSFDEIKDRLQGTSVLNDYLTPLPPNQVNLIERVLVAYHKYGTYLNANKWEYRVTFDLLKDKAAACLRQEVAKLHNEEDEMTDEDDTLFGDLNDLVEVLVNHRSFVDPLAAEIWTEGNEQKELYESCFRSVSKIFTDLQFKIPLWSCEISSALD